MVIYKLGISSVSLDNLFKLHFPSYHARSRAKEVIFQKLGDYCKTELMEYPPCSINLTFSWFYTPEQCLEKIKEALGEPIND